MKKKISCVIGTRPEIIKMAPVVQALQQTPWADVTVINTGQHQTLADSLYTLFKITPDVNLNILKPGQSLAELTATLILNLDKTFLDKKPDMIIGQGDTTTVLAAALTSFYHQIPFAHVEAGLRTYQHYNPFPEEANRLMIARLASLHFAPTIDAKAQLIKENISEANIYVTGNTIADAILSITQHSEDLPFIVKPDQRVILVTVHRRENLDKPLRNICQALINIVQQNPDVKIIFPMHPNPKIRDAVKAQLAQHSQIIICPSLAYNKFIAMLKVCYLILTDSGGIQEEATILGKPVLILRETTERYEAVRVGTARLIGTQSETIVKITQELLDNPIIYKQMAQCHSIYGDGQAARRIIRSIQDFLLKCSKNSA